MKAIVIGTSLSGKTTLVRFLKEKTDFPLIEVDEELTRANSGTYPLDNKQKHTVLIPKIIKRVLNSNDIVFFTNTDYFTFEDLATARRNGFFIIQLSLDSEQLLKRNKFRVENEGYSDLSQWLERMVNYQTAIREKRLVDNIIDASQSTEEIATELIRLLSKNS